jgi:NADPH:quinone reductase-like Zn-dependent oxidoreductase
MRAAVRTRYGPPDVVRIEEVEKPAAEDGEVLVRVHATTVNRTDCGLRAAKPFIYRFFLGLRRPRLTVLGNEFAGQVEAVGAGVTSFEVGDRVFGFSGNSFGAHAEYMTMPEDGTLATMPANLSYEEAAPSTEGAHYALSLLRTAKLQRGQGVLVNGATGAIGSSTTPSRTSPGTGSGTTWSWMRSARARSAGAGRC